MDPKYWALAPLALVSSTSGYATTYLTVEQAQAVIFPGATFTAAALELTPAERAAIEARAGVRVRTATVRAWRVAGGGWFLVDETVGKHEFITFALGLRADGTVQAIEIMDYREAYGYEVRGKRWRAQFAGHAAATPLRFGHDIKNISGATLSARHLTEAVNRLLATHELVLRTRG